MIQTVELSGGHVLLEAKVRQGARSFVMDPAYSGAIFDHAYYGRAVIDIAGIKVSPAGVPIYRQHAAQLFVGRSSKVELAGGRVVVRGFIFDGVGAADEVARISDQGGMWQASIHVKPDEEKIEHVAPSGTVTVNGVALAGPLAVIRESEMTEASWVPRGADTSTSAIALEGLTAVALAAQDGTRPGSPAPTKQQLRAAVERDAGAFKRAIRDLVTAGYQHGEAVALAAEKSGHAHGAYVCLANPESDWPSILARFR